MDFRITADGNERDIREIHEMLKKYNLAHREASQSVPIGIFLEDEMGRKLETAKLDAKRRGCKYAFVDTFSFQTPSFYKNHGYGEVFTLEAYPYTGKRHYYTKEIH